MLPVLRPGDWLELTKPTFRVGSIVVVHRADGSHIAHRIVRVIATPAGEQIITRGDNCPASDPVWSPDHILGEVERVVRSDKTFKPEARITVALRLRWLLLVLRYRVLQILRKVKRALVSP